MEKIDVTEQAIIVPHGSNCLIRVKLTPKGIEALCGFPSMSKWKDGSRDRIFKPTSANIRHVQQNWPSASWEEGAQVHLDNFIAEMKAAQEIKELKKEIELFDDGSYEYKTAPFDHQRKAFLLSRDKEKFALFMEQGTGKTKVALDKAAFLYSAGKIDCVIIIAQNGVHSNWIESEIPIHLPDWCPIAPWCYSAKITKASEKAFYSACAQEDKLKVFAFNIEGFTSEKAKTKLQHILSITRPLVIIDESQFIKNASSKRTKYLTSVCKSVKYKMIMTGTPVTKGVEDLYAQMSWLGKEILGFDNFWTFRGHFCNMGGFEQKQIVGYKNLDELISLVDGYSFRVRKKECLDLPDKIYKRFKVDLTPIQRKAYDDLKKNYIAEIKDLGTVTADLAIVRLLRLQQIACGWWPSDEFKPITGDNPKLEAVRTHCLETDGSVIVWARFIADIERLGEELRRDHGADCVGMYYGKTPQDERMELVRNFQDKKIKILIAHPQAAGRGLTLTACENPIYHSNDFNLELRVQSEDRCHRIGTTNSVIYTDIEAKNTVDKKIIDSLKGKMSIANLVTQDPESFFLED